MERRAFLCVVTGGLFTAPLAAETQPTRRIWQLGMLDVVSMAANATNLEAFRQGLRELGLRRWSG